MPSYGVRFYKVELFLGGKRTPIAFHEDDGKGKVRKYSEHLKAVLDQFKDTQVRGFPRSQDISEESVEEVRKKTAVVLNDVDKLGTAGIHAEFRVGRSDDYDRAYPAPDLGTTEHVNLIDYTPARPYRVALLIPDTGEVGLLAVEVIGRACPYEFFTKWATRWSRDYQFLQDQKEPLKDDAVRPWYRLRPVALGSKEQLEAFLKGGSIEEFVLINHYFDKSRNERFERFRLTARLDVAQRTLAKVKLKKVYEFESDEEFAKKLAKDFGHSVEELDIDDGYVVVKTDVGVKKVSPSRQPDFITYPVSEDRPTLKEFLAAVKTHGIPMAKAIDAQVDFSSW
ncbi:Uncharacterised protein [Mycobacteroides abscessus subsp. massiliense]|uniref:hypothetical protein n=1 Tax=Mycobacteroides abscessus TaxID=36809 RepID=UPI0009A5DD5A|nr:hypothetical protein [Mycobacteroides abscessus]SKS10189.1 Uncharacterised protein [Mycobacteroides abscessus subsp. massiliense]